MSHTSTATETILPAKNLTGSLRLPGDKSISHRYGMLAGLAEGTTLLTNFSTGADCASTLSVAEALGAKVVHTKLPNGEPAIEVTGVHPHASYLRVYVTVTARM